MDFSLFKNLDKAFDLEKVTGSVLSAVDEFPDRTKTIPDASKVVVTNAAVSKARQAYLAWEEVDLEGRKIEWEELCRQLKVKQTDTSATYTPQQWQQRAKDAEYKLYQICNVLLGAPDPLPFLESVTTLSAKIVEVESQNRELSAAAESASADMQEVQQLVEKHRTLEATHKELQEQLQKRDQELTEARQAAATAAEVSEELAGRNAELARLQAALKQLREEHERAQSSLFEVTSKWEVEVGSKQREVDLALEELERAQQRIAELELDKEARGQRQVADRSSEAAGAATPAAGPDEFWERQLQLKVEQVGALQAQLEALTGSMQEAAARHEVSLARANNSASEAALTVDKLHKELSRRPEMKEYEALRQRSEALRSLVDVQMEAEGWGKEQIRDVLRTVNTQVAQTVMQERNRKLSAEVSSLKREIAERDSRLAEQQKQLAAYEDELKLRQVLIKQLEEDLMRSSSGVAAGAAAAAVAGAVGAAGAAAVAGSSLLKQGSSELLMPGTPDAADGGSLDSQAASMLDIVVSQRDRFRQRVTQLEEEKGKLNEELQKARHELEKCRADNVTLYEKVRYLERYSQKAAATGKMAVLKVDDAGVPQAQAADAKANRYQCGPVAFEFGSAEADSGPGPGSRAGGAMRIRGARKAVNLAACFPGGADDVDEESGGPEAKYARAYEARVNPFAEFQKTEVEQRVRNLQLHDRAVLAGSKLLVGSRIARAFVATYAVLLHLFIMVLLYYSMMPRTQIEMVDMDAITQQAAAASTTAANSNIAAAAVKEAAKQAHRLLLGHRLW